MLRPVWFCSCVLLVNLKSITMHEALMLEIGQLKAVCDFQYIHHVLFLLS